MSERKVLNKYFPPDFDPNNIPKLGLEKNRQWNIRIMAPFNMRCSTCGEYIYKGKKFNSRKEDVEDDDYLGLKIFRFYIRCPRCVAEISFKTDPVNTDYALEAGATRNFEALKTAETLARKEMEEKEAAEKNNPMKMLENRTKQSLREMEMLETLEDLKQLNSRHADVDTERMLLLNKAYEKTLAELQDEEDEKFVDSLFGGDGESGIKRLVEEDEVISETSPLVVKKAKHDNPTDILTQNLQDKKTILPPSNNTTKSAIQSKFGILVKKKTPATSVGSSQSTVVNSQSDSGTLKASAPQSSLVATNKAQPSISTVTASASTASIRSDKPLVVEAASGVSESASTVGGAVGGLGLLGAYSDSDDSQSD